MLVALTSSSDALVVAARAWTNATDGSLSGVNKSHRRCAADDTPKKAAPRVVCDASVEIVRGVTSSQYPITDANFLPSAPHDGLAAVRHGREHVVGFRGTGEEQDAGYQRPRFQAC